MMKHNKITTLFTLLVLVLAWGQSPMARAQATHVQTIDTSVFSPPSPDPAGITYIDTTDTLLETDSEVNEISGLFQGDNVFEVDHILGGQSSGVATDDGAATTIGFSNEPTGVAYNPNDGTYFICDDSSDQIYHLDPGPDGRFDTADDTLTDFDTRGFGSRDPEGIAFDPVEVALYVVDGLNGETYKITPGPNGIFDGVNIGDDVVTSWDTEVLGLTDPEGITYESDNGHLYIIGEPITAVFHTTTAGAVVRTVDISDANPVRPAGLGAGPSSLGGADPNPTALNLYITDRGIDNNQDPLENDGKVYEFSIPPLVPANQPPQVSAGPDLTVTLPNDAFLDGTVADDGLPTPPTLTTDWSQVSGPGTVTFTPSSAVDTTASFSVEGDYVLRLTADDTEFQTSDDMMVTVLPPSAATFYISTTTTATPGGVTLRDEDIGAFDTSTGTWSRFIDGSDVGLAREDIDAFHINSDGSILLSLNSAATVPDVGAVEEADILRFIPTSTGTTTAGTFELYFDGSDVDLTAANEDVDAIGFDTSGRLLISTTGSATVGGLSANDEDLLAFTAITLGETTSGTWEMYFDGSDVELSNGGQEDVNGAWNDDNGNIYLTTVGAFSVTGVSGDGADIFVCVPVSTGDDTSCAFSPFFDGSDNGLAGEIIDGFYLSL